MFALCLLAVILTRKFFSLALESTSLGFLEPILGTLTDAVDLKKGFPVSSQHLQNAFHLSDFMCLFRSQL